MGENLRCAFYRATHSKGAENVHKLMARLQTLSFADLSQVIDGHKYVVEKFEKVEEGLLFQVHRLNTEGYRPTRALDGSGDVEHQDPPEGRAWLDFTPVLLEPTLGVFTILERTGHPTMAQAAKLLNKHTKGYELNCQKVLDIQKFNEYVRDRPIYRFECDFAKPEHIPLDPPLGHGDKSLLLSYFQGGQVRIEWIADDKLTGLNKPLIEKLMGLPEASFRAKRVQAVKLAEDENGKNSLDHTLELIGAKKVHDFKLADGITRDQLPAEYRSAVRRAWNDCKADITPLYQP